MFSFCRFFTSGGSRADVAIDASRAFVTSRTGVEEYSYRLIKHLRGPLWDRQIVLFVRFGQVVPFEIPPLWRVVTVYCPLLWTQIGLFLVILCLRPRVFFSPSYVPPLLLRYFSSVKTIFTVHGVEFKTAPQCYPLHVRLWSTFVFRFWMGHVQRMITVSGSTKDDLVRFFGVFVERVVVVHNGVTEDEDFKKKKKNELNCSGQLIVNNEQLSVLSSKFANNNSQLVIEKRFATDKLQFDGNTSFLSSPFLLYVGRLERRKNVVNLVRAFEIYCQEHVEDQRMRLVLVGGVGYGYREICTAIDRSCVRERIILCGYVTEEEKRLLYSRATVVVFLSLAEGFGFSLLEAQAAEVPVVCSDIPVLREVGGTGAVFVDPLDVAAVARSVGTVVADSSLRRQISSLGRKNVYRFSWEQCARETVDVLLGV